MQTQASDPNAARDAIAAEIVALTGCPILHANVAAHHWLTFPNAPDHGLSGMADEWVSCHARTALKAWLSAKVAAEIAQAVAA